MAMPSWVAAGELAADRFETAAARIAGSRTASVAVIVLFALVCFLPGFFSIPPLDGEETGYMVGAREIVATTGITPLNVQTDMQPWRPHGTEWVQAITAVVLGQGAKADIWVYRLPSLIAGLAAAVFVWWTALAFGRPRAALLAGLLFAASGIVGLQARMAAPDALLVAAATLAAGALARLWLTRDGETPPFYWAILFWVGVGAGILFKGIVAPAMAFAAVVILTFERGSFRWWRLFNPGAGIAILVVVLTPWLVSVAALSVADIDGPDIAFLTRIGVPFRLEAPPGSYILLAPLLVGPAMTFILIAMPWLLDNLGRREILFALAWGGPLWIAIEFYPEKLPQYVLPAVPALAWMAAAAIDEGVARIRGKVSLFYSAGPLVWPPLIVVAVPVAYMLVERRVPFAAIAAFLVAALAGPLAWLWLRQRRAVAATLMSVVTVVFIYLGFFGFMLPDMKVLRVAERIYAIASAAKPCGVWLAAAGYPEESLVFVAGRGTVLTDGFGAAEFLDRGACRAAAIDTRDISSFRQRMDDLGLDAVEQGRVDGVNLRKARAVSIHVFTAEISKN